MYTYKYIFAYKYTYVIFVYTYLYTKIIYKISKIAKFRKYWKWSTLSTPLAGLSQRSARRPTTYPIVQTAITLLPANAQPRQVYICLIYLNLILSN